MGKASRKKRQGDGTSSTPAVLPAPYVARPFQGVPGETDLVAMREIVPSATVTFPLQADALGRAVAEQAGTDGAAGASDAASDRSLPTEVTLCTILPMAWPALRRTDGTALVALQTIQAGGDASRDIAQAIVAVAQVEPGTPVTALPQASAQTPRLQELLTGAGDSASPAAGTAGAPAVQVQDDFDYWLAPGADLDAEGKASLQAANEAILPTTRLASVDSAYWVRVGERTHIRWILPHDEDAATDALARLHAAGKSDLGEGTRLLGAFRTSGLLCPVWDLDPAKGPEDYEKPMADMAAAFAGAMTDAPLTFEERRAKSGLLSRQLTLR